VSRSYRSIGDVLTLLRPEFEDITISKIRFLEAQGLVSPQRSPSGYRKFYEEDVERLRYVLLQQRDHFLPLKVIRDRLNGVTSEEDTGAGDPPPEVASKSATKSASTNKSSLSGSSVTGSSPTNSVTTPPAKSAAPTAAPPAPANTATPRATSQVSTTPPPASSTSATSETSATQASPTSSHKVHAEDASKTAENDREPTVADVLAALQEVPAVRQRAVAAAEAKVPRHASRSVLGVTMTTTELSVETGLSEKEVTALVEFGILRQVSVAGLSVFDERNVAIARAATGILALGIEPRHLRQFRNSVDREMGLIEQLITPILRQRNPEAVDRAASLTDEMVLQGEALRAALLQAEVDAFLSR
jgi:DNA-binding transcriptional MerR regulator